MHLEDALLELSLYFVRIRVRPKRVESRFCKSSISLNGSQRVSVFIILIISYHSQRDCVFRCSAASRPACAKHAGHYFQTLGGSLLARGLLWYRAELKN